MDKLTGRADTAGLVGDVFFWELGGLIQSLSGTRHAT
jgi:hypothetical protein